MNKTALMEQDLFQVGLFLTQMYASTLPEITQDILSKAPKTISLPEYIEPLELSFPMISPKLSLDS